MAALTRRTDALPHGNAHMSQLPLCEALETVRATWDEAIAGWLGGAPGWSKQLSPWARAYAGRGEAVVIDDAVPEPWFGALDRTPAVVFLALNPGQPFLGERRWRGRLPIPDLQSRDGVFASEIRAAGSYSAWAAHWPDWSRWVPGGNPFYNARLRFARDWLRAPALGLDRVVLFEAYPWHSVKFHEARLHPGGVALECIRRFVLGPVAALRAPWVFAFGAAWPRLLDAAGLVPAFELSTRAGDVWPGAPKDRVVRGYRLEESALLAEWHMGSAAPPATPEVPGLRAAVEARLERVANSERQRRARM